MRFRCDVCDQCYTTTDEPAPGRSYRIPCSACGGSIAVRGADFPALPTILGSSPVPDGAGEEPPIRIALAPAAQGREPAAEGSTRQRVRHPRLPRRRILAPLTAVAVAAPLLLAWATFVLVPRPRPGEAPAMPMAGAPGDVAPEVPRADPAPAAGGSPGSAGSPAPAPPPATPASRPPAPFPSGPAAAPTAPPRRAPRYPPALTRQQVAAVLRRSFDSFRACDAREPAVRKTSRRVTVFLTVTPTGSVAASWLSDPALSQAPLGRCLVSAGSRLVFPEFEGEPVRVEVPYVFPAS